jgi:EF-P beta-lysylation protein EpmB
MITKSLIFEQSAPTHWQDELRRAIDKPLELLNLLELSHHALAHRVLTTPRFKMRVPRGYVARMRKGDPDDPLLRQVLPVKEEQKQVVNYHTDPTGDVKAEIQPGLLQKYYGRILLLTTSVCPIHCRYCFRQYYTNFLMKPSALPAVLETIRRESSIKEVILSGGDPLCLSDKRLAKWVNHLAMIPHLQRLRLHTRLPIILPERINGELLTWLTSTRLQPIVVIHANHANEIDKAVSEALQTLVQNGITVLNQSVLLRGVNDNISALIALSETLFSQGVLPYYLHLLDRVQGAAHFEVSESSARQLLQAMQVKLPGYLVPKLVREVVGTAYKQWIF